MKKNTKKDVLQDKILYVGTTEQVAKLAPTKGLEPPIFLTDVYPGFFCKQSCKNEDERWGIITVSFEQLNTDSFAPSPAYIDKFKNKTSDPNKIFEKISSHKSKWQTSLENCGVCVYLAHIPASAIKKVMIYSPGGRNANKAINNLVNELPKPNSLTPAEHKATYSKSLGILRWFNGEFVRCEDIFNGQTNIKLVNELDDKLNNRFGLDLYYLKAEEKKKKMPKDENILVRFEFGKFGNYGTQLVVKMQKDSMPTLSLENWAYGETSASITTFEGVNSDNLEKLGKALIQAAAKLNLESVNT